MRVTLRTTALAVFTCLALLADARAVRAFCRSTNAPLRDEDGCMCTREGAPLFWPETTIEYTFNEDGFPGVSDAALRQVFARSFAHWSDVQCDGEPVALSLRAMNQTTSETHEALAAGPNTSVIAHLSEAEFLRPDRLRSPFAFAVTNVAYRPSTGEIFDVDILFNEGRGPFAVCPEEGCAGRAVDIENVATHEIGHLFGLAHSDDRDATMACTADQTDIDKRSLAADDIAGICAIYGPDAIEERAEALTSRRRPAACACRLASARDQAPVALALSLALVALFAARRRRR